MTQDNTRMGDLNELVERLRIGTPENPEYEVVWVQKLRAHFKEGIFSHQYFPEWNDIFLANVNALLSASEEAAAALTSLIAERDELLEYASTSTSSKLEAANSVLLGQLAAAEAQLKAARELADGLNVTDQELVRINNMCVGFDGDVKIWAKMLQKLAVFAISARTALSLDTNKGDAKP